MRKRIVISLLIFFAFLYVNNSSFLSPVRDEKPFLLAHRGLAQTFPLEGIESDTCTARIINEPEHPYLENTIPSMKAAFAAGADIVELDVHPTTDGEFAVFHDWTLDCRTDGNGVTREHSMEELKRLDIGYGYTADGGKTFPFRGNGRGMMPTLKEVLTQFPERAFLIHIKSNDRNEGVLLAEYLNRFPEKRLESLIVYGGDEPISAFKEMRPDVRVMSKERLKSCLLTYMAIGWTGYIPKSCENSMLLIPEKVAKFLWGFPTTFQERMKKVHTIVVLIAGDGRWSEGFDDVEDLKRLPENYQGGIWTNRIDQIGAVIKNE